VCSPNATPSVGLDEQSHQHLSPMTPSSYTNLIHNPTASSVQHKRNRLAEKAKTNNGKDTLQISQELHVKKPRESPGKTVTKSQDVDFFVQHF